MESEGGDEPCCPAIFGSDHLRATGWIKTDSRESFHIENSQPTKNVLDYVHISKLTQLSLSDSIIPSRKHRNPSDLRS